MDELTRIVIDDDPAGPDQTAEDILHHLQLTTLPRWARLLERLMEGIIYP